MTSIELAIVAVVIGSLLGAFSLRVVRHLALRWIWFCTSLLPCSERRRRRSERGRHVGALIDAGQDAGYRPLEIAMQLLVGTFRGSYADLGDLTTGLCERLARALRKTGSEAVFGLGAPLNPRSAGEAESQLIDLISSGLSNKEIAAELGVSRGAVEQQLADIYARHGVGGRVELALLAAHVAPKRPA